MAENTEVFLGLLGIIATLVASLAWVVKRVFDVVDKNTETNAGLRSAVEKNIIATDHLSRVVEKNLTPAAKELKKAVDVTTDVTNKAMEIIANGNKDVSS